MRCLPTCDDAGNVFGGVLQLIAAFVMPEGFTLGLAGAGAKRVRHASDVVDAAAACRRRSSLRRWCFKKRLELVLVDAAGDEDRAGVRPRRSRGFAVQAAVLPWPTATAASSSRSSAGRSPWRSRPPRPRRALVAAAILRLFRCAARGAEAGLAPPPEVPQRSGRRQSHATNDPQQRSTRPAPGASTGSPRLRLPAANIVGWSQLKAALGTITTTCMAIHAHAGGHRDLRTAAPTQHLRSRRPPLVSPARVAVSLAVQNGGP